MKKKKMVRIIKMLEQDTIVLRQRISDLETGRTYIPKDPILPYWVPAQPEPFITYRITCNASSADVVTP